MTNTNSRFNISLSLRLAFLGIFGLFLIPSLLKAQDAVSHEEQYLCLEWGNILVDEINEGFHSVNLLGEHSVNGLGETAGYFKIVGYKPVIGYTTFSAIPVVEIRTDSITGFPSENGTGTEYFAIWPYYGASAVFPGWNYPSISGPNGDSADTINYYNIIQFTVPFTSGPNAAAEAPVVWEGVDFSDYGSEDSIDLVQVWHNVFGYQDEPDVEYPMPWNFPEEDMNNDWEEFWDEWYNLVEDNIKAGNTDSTALLVENIMAQPNPSIHIQRGNMWKLETDWFLGLYMTTVVPGVNVGLQTKWDWGYSFIDHVYYPSIIGDTVPGYGAPSSYDGETLSGSFEGNSLASGFPILSVGEVPVKMDTATTGHFLTFHWRVTGANRWHATRWNVTLTPQADPGPEPWTYNDYIENPDLGFEEADPDPDDYLEIVPPKVLGPIRPVVLIPEVELPYIDPRDTKGNLSLDISAGTPLESAELPSTPWFHGDMYPELDGLIASSDASLIPVKSEPIVPCSFEGDNQVRISGMGGFNIVVNYDYDTEGFFGNSPGGSNRRTIAEGIIQELADMIVIDPSTPLFEAIEPDPANGLVYTPKIKNPSRPFPWLDDRFIPSDYIDNVCIGENEMILFLGSANPNSVELPTVDIITGTQTNSPQEYVDYLSGPNTSFLAKTGVSEDSGSVPNLASRGRTSYDPALHFTPTISSISFNSSQTFSDTFLRTILRHELLHALGVITEIGDVGLVDSATPNVPFAGQLEQIDLSVGAVYLYTTGVAFPGQSITLLIDGVQFGTATVSLESTILFQGVPVNPVATYVLSLPGGATALAQVVPYTYLEFTGVQASAIYQTMAATLTDWDPTENYPVLFDHGHYVPAVYGMTIPLGLTINGLYQIPIMAPKILPSDPEKFYTYLDLAFMEDIGWPMNP